MNKTEIQNSILLVSKGDYDEDFRLIDYLRDKADYDERRVFLLETERLIKQIAGPASDDNNIGFCKWGNEEIDSLRMLVSSRGFLLNLMMRPTPNEVRRLEVLNAELFRITKEMERQADCMGRMFAATRHKVDDKQRYDIEGELKYEYNEASGALVMPEDRYYGSDFSYMLNLQTYLLERSNEYKIIDRFCPFDESMDDGTTWAEGPLHRPAFSQICICHAVHAICTHMDYSIPDLLRMTSFVKQMHIWYEREDNGDSPIQ